MTTIAQLLAKDNYLTTFVKGLKAAGLTETLEAEGPFTVFAPTNLSFGKLDSGVVREWEEGQHVPQLKNLLNHHIL